jgi:hypothetical protein
MTAEREWNFAPPILEELFASEESDSVRRGWAAVLSELTLLKELCARHSAEFMLLYVPVSTQISQPERFNDRPQRRLREFAEPLGVPFIDPSSALRTRAATTLNEGYQDLWHWSAQGHQVAAEELAAAIKR